MKRYFILFSGRVQGVGFRYFCYTAASTLGLTGSVRNLSNGCVEVLVQGEEDKLTSLLQVLLRGNGYLRIDDYSLKEIPLVTEERKFTILG